jgi:hypothetical protein
MATAQIQRVLLTGDVHGNTQWLIGHVLQQAQNQDCQLVLQLGDFGIWPGRSGTRFLDVVNREYQRVGIPLWFIDGNHEDFDQLYALPLDEHGRRPVREFIAHLPRGHRWSWGGREILACGGAASIDMDLRLPRRTWWPQESITDDEVEQCIAGGSADVLLSHDVQLEVEMTDAAADNALPPFVLQATRANRARLQRIVETVRPSLQVHGHWHHPYDETLVRGVDREEVRIVSLNCESEGAFVANAHCAVLEIDMLPLDVQRAVRVID